MSQANTALPRHVIQQGSSKRNMALFDKLFTDGTYCAPGAGDGTSKQRGFTIIELIIVVTVILIIAAIVIPSLLRSKMLANESSAAASLRTITTAESTYAANWGSGYAASLANLGGAAPCMPATPAAGCIIDPLLSTGTFTKSGYVFKGVGTLVDPNGVLQGFELNATPSAYQVSGMRAFCDDQSGVLKYVLNGSAPIGVAAGSCAAVPNVIGVSGPVGN